MGIQSAIISHCANEASLFLPKGVDSQESFDAILDVFLPGSELSPQKDAIRQQYDCEKTFEGNFTKCIGEIIQDLSFTCNTRNLFDSYPSISYMMQYAFPFPNLAVHASDLIPLFMNNQDEAVKLLELSGITGFLAQVYASMIIQVSSRYQNYLASFALTGDPNALPWIPSFDWPVADGSGDKLSNVLTVRAALGQSPFVLDSDDQNSKSKCGFWTDIAESIAVNADRTSGNQKVLSQQAQNHWMDL
jgi:carboxylesterase type B